MKINKTKRLTLVICVLLFALSVTSQASVSIDFGSGSTWDSSNFGGSASSSGWDNSGVSGGKTTLVDGSESVDVTISISTFGSAVGYHSAFHQQFGDSSKNYLVTSPTFNGTADTSSPALVYALNNDYSAFGSNFANYGVLTFEFSKPVVLSAFTVGDIDKANNGGWTDVVAAEGSSNGVSVVSTLAAAGNPYNMLDSSTFLNKAFAAGQILGIGQSPNDQDYAEGGVDFNNAVTKIDLYYWNNDSAGEQHGVYVQSGDITIVEIIPEPASIGLIVGIGGLALLVRRTFLI